MNREKYPYKAGPGFLTFLFDSIGPNGCIKKIVSYTPFNFNGMTYFNLAFGDLNEATGRVDDRSRSNNEDRDKVLATVVDTIIEFSTHFPDAYIYIQGSTGARTRLYQMGINANWRMIQLVLNVSGYINNEWQLFEPNVNYQAFLVFRK